MKKCHTDYRDWVPLYALGSLDTAETHRFQAHLSEDCLHCRSLLAVYDNVAALLNRLAPTPTPPSELSRRRMQRRVQAQI